METSIVRPDIGRTRTIESQQGISWLPKLPREVLFMIAEHLERPSQILLALTCKSLFTSLCPGRLFPKLDEKDLPSLLLQLEKENPNWSLCFGCTRLRPLRRDSEGNLQGQLHPHCDSTLRLVRWSHSLRLPKIRRSGCRGAVDGFAWIETLSLVTWRPAVLGPGGHVPEITFSEGHLVMNRHFYGPRFGLPTRHLESVFEFERRIPLDGGGGGGELGTGHFPLGAHPPRGGRYHLRPPRRNGSSPPTRWVFAHRTSAKVLDDELYLRRSHTVSGPPCSASDFSRVVDGLELPVCRHILGSSRMPSSRFWEEGDNCLPELQNLRIAAAEPALDLHPDDAVGSCVLCFTDYEVAIQRGGWPDGLEFEADHVPQAREFPIASGRGLGSPPIILPRGSWSGILSAVSGRGRSPQMASGPGSGLLDSARGAQHVGKRDACRVGAVLGSVFSIHDSRALLSL
ncbi:hypothetical protein C8034_v003678 [Colletotrichum sidae]|uniref:F-box domain-containing protein n=1 Tax=Colletotrichum sidae TaxID=1347389 RepID=A0A4R8S7E9_9PEZI|nr:hypothetical protein C8034_v003678 [Colletotrichum sidae]